MRKRTTDSKVLKTMGGRAGPRSSALCLRLLVAGAAVAMALGGVATPAYALNGKSGEFEDFEGLFRPSAPSCDVLRDETDLLDGDEIFVCDSDGEQCHLVSGTTDEGIGLGFCADEIETAIPVRAGDIHPEVSIKGTTFGTVIGVVEDPTATDPVDRIPGDIFCETSGADSPDGSPGTKVCVHIFKGTGDCTGDPPLCTNPPQLTVKRDANNCATVKALLRASVTSDSAINLRWWLFSDSEATGEPDGKPPLPEPSPSEVLSVCPGFTWKFLTLNGDQVLPQDEDAPAVAVKYQVSRVEIQTPHYVTISGRRICKKVAGEIPTHSCP